MRIYKQRPFTKLPVIHESEKVVPKPRLQPTPKPKAPFVEPTIAVKKPKIEEFILNYKYKCTRLHFKSSYDSEMKAIENIINRYSDTEFLSHRDVEVLCLIFQSCLNRTDKADDKPLQDYMIGHLVRDLRLEEHVFEEGLFNAKGEPGR